MTNPKNTTSLASILGTWTGQTHLKTDIGSNELLAYFVVHFMPDPMRGYGCSLKDCIEEQNQVCEVVGDGGTNDHVCSDMTGKVVDWSDGTYSTYLWYRIVHMYILVVHTSIVHCNNTNILLQCTSTRTMKLNIVYRIEYKF